MVVLNLEVVGKDDQFSAMDTSAPPIPHPSVQAGTAPKQTYGHTEMKAISPYASKTSHAHNNRPVVRSGGDESTIPINALNPYTNRYNGVILMTYDIPI